MIPKLILLGVTVCLDVHIYLDPVYKKIVAYPIIAHNQGKGTPACPVWL